MTEEERRNRIQELLDEITPMNYERTYISTKLNFDKENYFKNYTDDLKNEIIESENKLNGIINKLTPLYTELRNLQVQYQIQYKAEYTGINNSKYWETHTELVFLITDCDIDTVKNGWEPYMNDHCVNKLLVEVHDFLFQNRFSNFDILNIRKL